MTATKRAGLVVLAGILLLGSISCSCPSTPSISSISPNTATAGGAGVALTVNGGNFSSNSVVVWNGTVLTTSLVSSSQLTASIPGSDIAQPDTAVVYVYNAANASEKTSVGPVTATDNNQCGAAGSNSVSFTVTQ